MPEHIVVDETFIKRVIEQLTTLKTTLEVVGEGTGTAQSQVLTSLSTRMGTDQFLPAKQLRDAILATGNTLATRVQRYADTTDGLVVGLTDFLAEADYIESLNTTPSGAFSEYVSVKPPPTTRT